MRRRFDSPPWRRRQSGSSAAARPIEGCADLSPSAQSLAQSLTVPGTPDEVAGERAALTAYRAVFGTTSETGRMEGRRAPVVVSLAGARIGVAAAGAVVLGLGGLSAAAYSGALPDSAQNVAHEAIGAPAAKGKGHKAKSAAAGPRDASQSGAPTWAVGPDASGPAAHGLCRAFDPAKEKDEARKNSVAYRNLVTAAGGAAKLKAYCAAAEKAHKDKAARDAASKDKPTNKPTDKPGKPTDKAKPSTKAETDKPSARPTTKATPSRTATATASPAPTTGATASTGAMSVPTTTASSATTGS
jgi:hypothetical protein